MQASKQAAQILRPNGLHDGGMSEGVAGGVAGGEEVGTLVPSPDSPYAALGEVEPVNLISFAYQIASGMVRATFAIHQPLYCTTLM